MIINLGVNGSDPKKLSKNIRTIASLNGTLRDASSIIDPVIRIEGDVSQYAQCNYMTIPDFGRSYFIRDIVSENTSIFTVFAHVDVLSSFASEIRGNRAVVYRQENEWNLYLDDGSFKVYNNPKIIVTNFPSGFNAKEYVLAISGS